MEATIGRAGRQLLSGQIIGQLVMLASTVLVARWVSPEHYALQGMVLGGAFLINSFNTLAIELRIPVAPERDLEPLLRVGVASALVVGAIPLLVGVVVLARAPGSDAGPLLCAIALGAVATAMHTLLVALHTRAQAFGSIARMRIVQTSVNACAMIVLSSELHNWQGLVCAWILSVVVSTATAGDAVRGALRHGRPRRRDLCIVRREVGPAPIAQLLSGISTQLVLIVLPMFAGKTVAGEWALVSRVFGAARTTVVATAQPLYIGRAGQFLREDNLAEARRWHTGIMVRLALLTTPMFLACAGVLLFALPSLSDSWSGVGRVLPAAIAAHIAQSVAAPLSGTLMLLGRYAVALRWEIVRVTGAIGAIFAGSRVSGIAALDVWAATTVVLYLGLLTVHDRQLNPSRNGR